MNSPKKLYTLLTVLCIGGYFYLFYHWVNPAVEEAQQTLCIFKTVTNIPCPSCGSTRSVLAILKGELVKGATLNPLGYLLLGCLLVLPFWIVLDAILKKRSLFNFVEVVTYRISQRPYAILLIGLVLLNWIWNINKGL